MDFSIEPLTPPDCSAWQTIHSICYAGETERLLLNAPLSAESLATLAHCRQIELRDPGVYVFKVVDNSTTPSTIAAVAKWTVFTQAEQTEAATKNKNEKFAHPDQVAFKHVTPPPELNKPMLGALLGPLREANAEIMKGKEYVMLNSLTTLPEYQRRGLGRRLVQWGLDKAQELGLDMYLDSSEEGKKLYESVGFEVVRSIYFDRIPWGGYDGYYHYCMVRKRRDNR